MNYRVLELVICPECKGDLQIEVFDGNADGHIIDGMLACIGCRRRYPVIDGIPRLLPDSLMGNLFHYHRRFFSKYQLSPPRNISYLKDDAVCLKQKTFKSFSFQWNAFGEIFQEYRQHWHDYLPDSLGEFYFKGKLGLDAGCGFGRHIIQAAEAGAEMVGIDLSEAVKAAYANTRYLKNVHIIQGDIYNPPFRKGMFDFIYSIGVLHHLPEPQKGYEVLVNLLDSKQEIFIWCYDNEKPRKNAIYERIRRYSTRISFRSLYILTFLAALGVRAFLNYPAILLRNLGMKNRKVPYDYYLKYPFRVLHADLFDVFSVPSTKYYDQSELDGWFVQGKLKTNEIKHAVSGWTIYGKKNGSVPPCCGN